MTSFVESKTEAQAHGLSQRDLNVGNSITPSRSTQVAQSLKRNGEALLGASRLARSQTFIIFPVMS